VRGIHDRRVGERQELVLQRRPQVPRQIVGGVTNRREEVGPTDVPDEESVAGEHRVGRAPGGGAHHHRDRLRSVSGRLEYLEVHVVVGISENDGVSVGHGLDVEGGSTLGGPTEYDRCSRGIGQFEMPRQKIGVEVGLDHPVDRQAGRSRVVEILRHVALRVDHRGHAARGVADEIRRVRQTTEVVLLEIQGHGFFSRPDVRRVSGTVARPRRGRIHWRRPRPDRRGTCSDRRPTT